MVMEEKRMGQFTIDERKKRITLLMKWLRATAEKKVDVDLDKFKAEMSLRTGCSEEKIMEYVDQLQRNGNVVIECGKENNPDVIKFVRQQNELL